MNKYTLQFTYNGKDYSFALQNPQDFDSNLNQLDATVIVEAIIEKKIPYVKGEKVHNLCLVKNEWKYKHHLLISKKPTYPITDKLAFSVLNKLLTLSPFELHGWGKSVYALRKICAEKFITC